MEGFQTTFMVLLYFRKLVVHGEWNELAVHVAMDMLVVMDNMVSTTTQIKVIYTTATVIQTNHWVATLQYYFSL